MKYPRTPQRVLPWGSPLMPIHEPAVTRPAGVGALHRSRPLRPYVHAAARVHLGLQREVASLATRTSEAEARAELTLSGLRGEIKQALAAAAASTKAEAEAASGARVKEVERRLTSRLRSESRWPVGWGGGGGGGFGPKFGR